MTNLEQYIIDATRTESRIPAVEIDGKTSSLLYATLQAMIAAGTILDQIKKNVFYGKPIDNNKTVLLANGLKFASTNVDVIVTEEDGLYVDKTKYSVDPRVFHAVVGIATESVELLEALGQEMYSEKEIDTINILEEFGDLNWYQAIGIDALGGSFDAILKTNIAKLKARYPEKFTSDNAINRDLDTERNILESGNTNE